MPDYEPQPFLPYGRQTICEADIAAVVEVLRSPFLTQGPTVPAFNRLWPPRWVQAMGWR